MTIPNTSWGHPRAGLFGRQVTTALVTSRPSAAAPDLPPGVRHPQQEVIDTVLTQSTVSMKKALRNPLHNNNLRRADFKKRRGQDSLEACLLLVPDRSNTLLCNALRHCTSQPNSIRLAYLGKTQRYKNATSSGRCPISPSDVLTAGDAGVACGFKEMSKRAVREGAVATGC